MNEPIFYQTVFWLGFVVCVAGGIGIAAVLTMWAVDRVILATRVQGAFWEFIFERARSRSAGNRPPRRRDKHDS